jgi:hypothetical protein
VLFLIGFFIFQVILRMSWRQASSPVRACLPAGSQCAGNGTNDQAGTVFFIKWFSSLLL